MPTVADTHTPGPWTMDSEFGTAIMGSNGVTVCAVLNAVNATKRQKPVPLDLNEIKANARLVVTAPDMLAALKDVVAALDGRVHSQPALKALANASEAIAKATGGTHA